MKKRIVAGVLGLIMAMTAVGCGKEAASGDAENASVNIEEAEVPEAADVSETDVSPEVTDVPEEKGYEAVTIDNYNLTTEYDKKPEKVVCLSLNSAEIIAALGEADSIVAVQTGNNNIDDVIPDLYADLKDVDIPDTINTGMPPTLEAMLDLKPDFVAMNGYYFFVPFFGTVEDYQQNDVKLYVTEGSYVDNCTIDNTYDDIRNIGSIFGENEKAEELISGMKDRFVGVEEKIQSAEKISVMAFDSISEDGLYTIAGGNGLEQQLLDMAGANNIFSDIESDFSTVSIEEIVARNPEYIVIHAYTCNENDAQSKIDALKAQKELEDVDAIKNDKFIIVNMVQVTPGLQNADFVEEVAKAIHADLF